MSSSKLSNLFLSPSEQYGPVLMWFWQDDITKEGISFQLEKFKSQGITNFFVHSAFGMGVDYLSDEFFELIRHTVSEAKRLGMKYWIYDELDWPSGSAGGLVFEKYPDARQKHLYCKKMPINHNPHFGEDIEVCIKGDFLCAQARFPNAAELAAEGLANEFVCNNTPYPERGTVLDITDKCKVSKKGDMTIVTYKNTSLCPEDVLVYYSEYNMCTTYAAFGRLSGRGIRGYLNMLSPDAVSKFIEVTHERYKKAIGDEFGKTVMGVFTDEPTTLYEWSGTFAGAWSDDFEARFKKEHGYDLRPYFYALFYEPLSNEDKKARYDYIQTLKHMYHESFCGTISKWCKKNGLLFTGHFGGEEELRHYIPHGDMQTELLYMDIPGIDSIYSSVLINGNYFNIAGKMLDTAAKYGGKSRTLCETYTISGADFRFPEMKRIANRLMVLGVNMIQYMGAGYSNADGRKMLDGTIGGYFNTLFPYYHIMGEYISGISALSANTKSENHVLMFIPLCEAISHCNHMDGYEAFSAELQRLYEDTVNALMLEHIGFDLVSEDFARDMKVKRGMVSAFGCSYDTVIFPSMRLINKDCAELIQSLRKNGVKTIFIEDLPKVCVSTAANIDLDLNFEPVYNMTGKDQSFFLIKSDSLPVCMTSYRRALANAAGHKILSAESVADFYVTHRTCDDADVYFIANDEKRKADIYIDAKDGMTIYNAETKKEMLCPVISGRIKLTLDTFGMAVIICDKKGGKKYTGMPEKSEEYTLLEYPDRFNFEAKGGNMVPLSYQIFDEETGMWYGTDALNFPRYMQFMPGQKYKMRAYYEFNFIPSPLYLNFETHYVNSLCINENYIDFDVNTKLWSEYDCKLDISGYVSPGSNCFEFECEIPKKPCALRPPYSFLSGQFHFESWVRGQTEPVPKVIKSGGWETQGYENFCGEGVYTINLPINEDFKKCLLTLCCDDVADIYVGGKFVCTKIWHANEDIDITKFAVKGDNLVEIHVTSTLGNLYGKRTKNGILKPVSLKLYK